MTLFKLSYRYVILIFILAAAAVSGYLLICAGVGFMGFPLDDAWIHQTYARNLGTIGEWSFIPGQPTAGSTAPIWSSILAVGYLLRFPPVVWVVILGAILLFVLSLLGYMFCLEVMPSKALSALGCGSLLALEWHLVWAALSGMETLLFAVFILAILFFLLKGPENWVRIGLFVGLAVWIRPDGLTLLGPVIYSIWFLRNNNDARLKTAAQVLGGFALVVAPYIVFNWLISHEMVPTTFFAKQAEYAVLRENLIVTRYLEQFGLVLVGVGVLLLPGFLWKLWESFKKSDWVIQAAGLWFLGYLGLYALRLPVTYQHGRYIIPAMPVFFILGWLGMQSIFTIRIRKRFVGVIYPAWSISLILVLVIFYFQGGQAYAQDVAIIETEMVATAKWVKENTAKDAVIAAHDIGAIGYYAEREIVDLAGLISPDVIPIIRIESELVQYLNQKEADYLITLQGWYPELEKLGEQVYQSKGEYSLRSGGTNMTVYRWGIRE